MKEIKQPTTGHSTLRKLVYAGLAGGLVGVWSVSAAAHGNASSHAYNGQELNWQADQVVVDTATTPESK